MAVRRRFHSAVVALVVTVSLGALTACQQSEEDRRDDYCKAVSEASADLTRTADEAGAGAFLQALPTLEKLAAKSPSDLKDEWQTYLGALHNLRDVLAETDVQPEELTEGVPARLSKAEKRELVGALRNVGSAKTKSAAQGITQQALDVCDTQIL